MTNNNECPECAVLNALVDILRAEVEHANKLMIEHNKLVSKLKELDDSVTGLLVGLRLRTLCTPTQSK